MGWGMLQKKNILPVAWEGKNIVVEGYISGVPDEDWQRSRFNFEVERIINAPLVEGSSNIPPDSTSDSTPNTSLNAPPDTQLNIPPASLRLLLSWYGYDDSSNISLAPGQKWQFTVRVRRPYSFMNPGGFDYESWMLQQGIQASGYIRGEALLIAPSQNNWDWKSNWKGLNVRLALNKKRHIIKGQIKNAGLSPEATAIITALMIGDRSFMQKEHYKVFRLGGISHLLAISGLHLTLVGGGVFLLLLLLLKYCFASSSMFPSLTMPAIFSPLRLAAILTFIFIWFYALWTGFALPVQRATIMLSVLLISLVLSRFYRPALIYFIAMALVLLINPLAGVTSGFYLSFAAAAMVVVAVKYFLPAIKPHIFSVSNSGGANSSIKGGSIKGGSIKEGSIKEGSIKEFRDKVITFFFDLTVIQLIFVCGFIPVTLFFFYEFSLIGVVINLVAIPLTSFILMPWVLLNNVLLFLFPAIANYSLAVLGWVLNVLYDGLLFLTQLPHISLALPQPTALAMILAILAIMILIFGIRPYSYFLSTALFLPLLFPAPVNIPHGQLRVTFLDVGQGLAVHLQTSSKHLLYDTGASFASGSDLGSLVIAPYFLHSGYKRIDAIMVSHLDNDHSGGLAGVLESVRADKLFMNFDHPKISADSLSKQTQKMPCIGGTSWQWDGVLFEIIHPTASLEQLKQNKPNDNSCVLLVTMGKNSLLLTGDITSQVEKSLTTRFPNMKVSLLQAPHHGSTSSSSFKWLKQINPEFVVFTSGYRNPYNHPHLVIKNRYTRLGALDWTTWESGAISFSMSNQTTTHIGSYRQQKRRYWHWVP